MPAIVRKIFEEEFTKRFKVEQSIAVNNGTSALIAPLWSMDLQPDDESYYNTFYIYSYF